MVEFKFNIIAEGNIYLVPKFVKCIHCGHEIPLFELVNHHPQAEFYDSGGCGLKSKVIDYARYFGVIKNVT